jgi:excisionase family DNA binding protein
MTHQGPDGRADTPTPATVFRRRRSRDRPAVDRLGIDVAEAAEMIGVSYNTLWRAVREDEFPAVRVRGRIVIPVRAVEMLFDSACATGELVDAAAWTARWTGARAGDTN